MIESAKEDITVYTPRQRHDLGFFSTWVVMLRNIAQSHDLIWVLFKRDFLVAYKKSFIGYGWMILSPVMGIVTWVFMQSTGLLRPGDVGIPYPAYVLIGTSMWGLFMGFFTSASSTLGAGSSLFLQVNFPHEVLLVKETATHIANFLITFGINIIFLIGFGVMPCWQTVFFPVVIVPLFLLGSALGLMVSLISVVAIDINRVIGIGMGMLLYATPVIYSDRIDNEVIRILIKYNPLTYMVCSARDIIIYGRLYDTTGYLLSAAMSLVLFLVSWRLFYVAENNIIERMI